MEDKLNQLLDKGLFTDVSQRVLPDVEKILKISEVDLSFSLAKARQVLELIVTDIFLLKSETRGMLYE